MRKANAYMGVSYLTVDGVGDVPLKFNWAAISALRSQYGDDWAEKIQTTLQSMDVTEMANILEICTEHSSDWWMKNSPPIVRATQAIQEALEASFFGIQKKEGGEDENPLTGLLTKIQSWLPLWGGSNSGADRQTSGT